MVYKAGCILLGSNDDSLAAAAVGNIFLAIHTVQACLDGLDVLVGKVMMIAETDNVEKAVMSMHIIRHDLRIGNARHDEYIGRMVDVAFLQRVEVDKPSIPICRVQDRLIKTGRNICQDLGLFFRT